MKRFLAFAGLGLLVLSGAGCDPRTEINSNTAVRTETETVSLEHWRTDVQVILAAYDEKKDAVAARDALLAVRVPGSARDIHLALVLALTSIAEGDRSADARLETARVNFNATP